jgi:hypothetical protein
MNSSSQFGHHARGYRVATTPLMNQQSRDILAGLLNKLSPYTSGAADALGQQALGEGGGLGETKMINDYKSKILPSILQNFGGFGSGENSGLNAALSQGSQGLGESLAARRENLQQNSIRDILGLNQSLLGMQPEEFSLQPKKSTGLNGDRISQILNILASAAGSFFGLG